MSSSEMPSQSRTTSTFIAQFEVPDLIIKVFDYDLDVIVVGCTRKHGICLVPREAAGGLANTHAICLVPREAAGGLAKTGWGDGGMGG